MKRFFCTNILVSRKTTFYGRTKVHLLKKKTNKNFLDFRKLEKMFGFLSIPLFTENFSFFVLVGCVLTPTLLSVTATSVPVSSMELDADDGVLD